ncbi:hypothetical protein K2Z84_31965 [Candidatus Binatia bacterium]|nr:hypothetical protein [Candidatus Binatia bacterium]
MTDLTTAAATTSWSVSTKPIRRTRQTARISGVSLGNLHQRVHRNLVPVERAGRTLLFSTKAIESRSWPTQNETRPGLTPNKQPRPKSKKANKK